MGRKESVIVKPRIKTLMKNLTKIICNVRFLQMCIFALAISTVVFAYSSKYNYNSAIYWNEESNKLQSRISHMERTLSSAKTPDFVLGSIDAAQRDLHEKNGKVFITKTGNKYHKLGCSHLEKSDNVYIIDEKTAALNEYTPCSDCH